jgi:hypothetical protein
MGGTFGRHVGDLIPKSVLGTLLILSFTGGILMKFSGDIQLK